MTVAMMTPLAAPASRYVSVTTFWGRRHRAQAIFLFGYLATWTGAALLIVFSVSSIADVLGSVPAVVLFFGAAAFWQFSWLKRGALRACRRTTIPIAGEGWHANRGALRFGALTGWRCVTTCWLLMAAAATAGHNLEAMVIVFVLQLRERVTHAYRPGPGAVTLLALAVWSVFLPFGV
jgi:predicted metal-binding membrane protein